MAVSVFPPSGGSPIKSIQRGVATTAGTVTISAVDTSKSTVRSFSTGSAGAVATNSTIPAHGLSGSIGAGSPGTPPAWSGSTTRGMSGTIAEVTMTGGSTDLKTEQYGAYLSGPTSLVVTGPCRWEVVEFN